MFDKEETKSYTMDGSGLGARVALLVNSGMHRKGRADSSASHQWSTVQLGTEEVSTLVLQIPRSM